MKNKFAIGLAIAAFTSLASSVAFAAGNVATGSEIKLSTTPNGTLAGVFQGSVISGPGALGSFLTFCLEKKEYFDPRYSLFVGGVTNATQNSALGTSGTYYAADAIANPEGGLHTATSDPISKATEWIFTQFYANQSAYAGTNALADSTQRAIWYLEGELNGVADMASYTGDSVAQGFVAAATAAVSGGWYDVDDRVRVLNLYKDANYTQHSQDQLYMTTPVPEPETYAMMLAGLGLIGFLAKRRRRNLL